MARHLLIGTRRGIFIGARDGGGWKFSGPQLAGQSILSANADMRGAVTLFSGRNDAHWGPGIRYSRDFGATWIEPEKQPRFAEGSGKSVDAIWQVVPGGADQPDVLYAGVTPAALFKSCDGGKSWDEVVGLSNHPTRKDWQPGNGGLCLHTILIDPFDSKHLIVGISAVGVFESFDEGASWTLVNQGLPCVFSPEASGNTVGSCIHKIAIAPGKAGEPLRLYQQNHVGLFRRDGLGAWENIQGNQPFTFGFPLVAHPTDPKRAYVIPLQSDGYRAPKDGALKVYETRDSGGSWTALDKGLPRNEYNGILRDAFAAGNHGACGLYFGTNGGQVFASEDEGENWTMAADLLPPVYSVRVVDGDF